MTATPQVPDSYLVDHDNWPYCSHMSTQTPATIQTIIDQLGGSRIFAMAFRYAAYDESKSSITLHVAPALCRAKAMATHVTVSLSPDDTYRVLVQRVNRRSFDVATLADVDMVYADSLRNVVESTTGLRLAL